MSQELMGLVDRTIVLLEQRRLEELSELLHQLHPADLAELLSELDEDERAGVVRLLSSETAAETIAELEIEDQAALIEQMDMGRTADIVREMSADDVADLMAELPPEKAGEILQMMEPEDASDVRELLEYHPETAGGRMTTEFVAVGVGLTAQGAIEELRRMAPDAETTYYVYVTNEQEQLQGVLSLRELIIAKPETQLSEIMRTSVQTVHVNEDQEEVARKVKKYNLLAVPVVDDQGVLCGIITVDDILDVLEEEATEDFYRAAGVGHDEQEDTWRGFWASVRSRLPWLLSLLVLSLVSGSIIERYSDVLAAITGVAFFITTMAGGSGNAATQALTVSVRGMATGEIGPQDIWSVVFREMKLGLAIGGISGVTLAVIAQIVFDNPWIGLIVGLAIFINLTLAKCAGSMVPFFIKRLGFDPAVASGPFIATVTDTTSMLIYFTITTVVLRAVGQL